MSKAQKIKQFNPNGPGIKNDHFIGLPFEEKDAKVVLLPVPWDVTASFHDGTASAPLNILKASYQLDLYDPSVSNAWQMGIYMRPVNQHWMRQSESLRSKARIYIDMLEEGQLSREVPLMQELREEVNKACKSLKNWVYQESTGLMEEGKLVGIIGGDHSVSLGFMEAIAERHEEFGILQIDAHMDLRADYEGFDYSHASIMYNALKISNLSKIVQVGVRDFCDEEWQKVQSDKRVACITDRQIKTRLFEGSTFQQLCDEILVELPRQVYISFDIDGLDPKLCPNTGTPVPGGLDFQEVIYLIEALARSGKTIIGFDLCEVAGLGNDWDGNVAARLAYRLCNQMATCQ